MAEIKRITIVTAQGVSDYRAKNLLEMKCIPFPVNRPVIEY